MKAVILSAGFGTRLSPITDKTPKPLIKVLDIKLLEYTLFLLSKFNICEVFINVFHLAEQFRSLNVPKNIKLTIKKENSIRGTLGGVLNFKDELKDDDFLVINGDILFYIDLERLIQNHKKKGKLASLVLKENREDHTPVFVDDFNNIISIKNSKQNIYKEFMFSGVQVLSPKIFTHKLNKKEPTCLVRDYYLPLLEEENYLHAHLLEENEFWYESGTLSQYLNTNLQIFKKLQGKELQHTYEPLIRDTLFYREDNMKELVEGIWRPKNLMLNSSLMIIPPVFISKGVEFGDNVKIGPNVIILEDVSIPSNSNLNNALLTKDITIT